MNITYQAERFSVIEDEVQPLWVKHYNTSAVERDKIPLAPCIEAYRQMDTAGLLHIVTVRRAGVLIGYFFNLITPRTLHYATKEAASDIYFIDCADAPMARFSRYRGLIRAMVKEMQALGVHRCSAAVKAHADIGAIWRREGWKPLETHYYILMEP